jgi:uncharacterized membrane protein
MAYFNHRYFKSSKKLYKSNDPLDHVIAYLGVAMVVVFVVAAFLSGFTSLDCLPICIDLYTA